jgi:hypothetical protein
VLPGLRRLWGRHIPVPVGEQRLLGLREQHEGHGLHLFWYCRHYYGDDDHDDDDYDHYHHQLEWYLQDRS